jgi:hypothetical protein
MVVGSAYEQVGNGDLVNDVPFDDGDLLGAGQVTTLVVHDGASVQVMLNPNRAFIHIRLRLNNYFDRGIKTHPPREFETSLLFTLI